jgi:hypothetical protein
MMLFVRINAQLSASEFARPVVVRANPSPAGRRLVQRDRKGADLLKRLM